MGKLFTFFLFLCCINFSKAGAQSPLPNWYVTNGTVHSIVQAGNNVYIGGDFTYVGPNAPFGASLNTGTGSPDLSFVKPNEFLF